MPSNSVEEPKIKSNSDKWRNPFGPYYSRFVSSKWTLLGALFLYVLIVIIPLYYACFYTIPPDDKLNKTEGVLHYKEIPGKGYLVGISTPEGEKYFTSKSPIGRRHSLPLKDEEVEKLVGKPVTIYWYRRPVYLGSYQNHLVMLIVDGKEIITRKITEDRIRLGKVIGPKIAFVVSILMFILSYSQLKTAKRYKSKFDSK